MKLDPNKQRTMTGNVPYGTVQKIVPDAHKIHTCKFCSARIADFLTWFRHEQSERAEILARDKARKSAVESTVDSTNNLKEYRWHEGHHDQCECYREYAPKNPRVAWLEKEQRDLSAARLVRLGLLTQTVDKEIGS